jgi:hypothetical protein
MSDYNTPIKILQQGSVLQRRERRHRADRVGWLSPDRQRGNMNVAAATGLTFQAGISNGGTTGRWSFGTVGLTSGVGTVATGLNRVISAFGNPVSADPPGLGSFTTVVIDLSLSAAGSVIFRGGVGSLPYTNNGTLAWAAWGT